MEQINKVTVIIRSVGERTTNLCERLILSQNIPKENLFIVQERPFSKAMKVSYQTGIDNNLPWTFCVDADVLLREGSIIDLLNKIEKKPDNTLGISGEVLDKLWGKKRTAGNHLFKTEFLHKMIENIRPYHDESIRPESDVIKKLNKNGLLFEKCDQFIGLHDYEQSYLDIARKAYTHSQKHPQHLNEFYSYWAIASKNDRDYEVALFGLSRGITHSGDLKIDVNLFEILSQQVKNEFGEKGNNKNDFSIVDGEDVLEEMNNADNYFRLDNLMKEKNEKIFRSKFYKKKYSSLIKHFAGRILKDLGLLK